jgi:hypothetical protein
MPDSLSVAVPPGVTPRQLASLASLLTSIRMGRWHHLAASFDRMDGAGAAWPDATAALLGALAGELERAASERRQPAGDRL